MKCVMQHKKKLLLQSLFSLCCDCRFGGRQRPRPANRHINPCVSFSRYETVPPLHLSVIQTSTELLDLLRQHNGELQSRCWQPGGAVHTVVDLLLPLWGTESRRASSSSSSSSSLSVSLRLGRSRMRTPPLGLASSSAASLTPSSSDDG